jgi:Ca-activated chloride channel family protein
VKGAALLALAAALAAPAEPSSEARAPLRERLAWNARERTAAGIEALAAGEAEASLPPFDTALALRPDEPRARYNAGTARVEVAPEAAAALLAEAAATAPPELAPDAFYNLGNARLAGGDARGAVEALVESLRRRPESLDAKHNLELALRALEQQQQQQQQQKQQRQQEQEQEPGDNGSEQQEQEQQQQRQPDAAPSETGSGPPEADSPPRQNEPPQPEQTPRFRDQPDMTAEQAAALLQAVENLEKRQRRARALDAARGRRSVEIDW